MPRLFALVCALVLLEGSLFTALGPLLPGLRSELGLSASQAGLLASAYVVGAVIATVPAALSTAGLGVKATAVVGVAVLGVMALAFGIAETYPELLAAQLVAGVGAGVMWVAAMSWLIDVTPPKRRGEVIGAAFSLTAAGEIAGPVIGGVAATAGRAPTFGAIGAVALLLAGLTSAVPAPAGRAVTLDFRTVIGSAQVRAAGGLSAVPMFVLGGLLVLGTLQLSHLGARPDAIAAVFVVGAVAAVVQGPLVGRWSDRRGRLRPIRYGFIAGIPTLLALAATQNGVVAGALLVVAMVTVRFSVGPTVALLSDACEGAGVGTVLTFLVVLPVTAAGIAMGTAGSGALTQAVGLSGTYLALAAILLAVLVGLRRQTNADFEAAASTAGAG